MKTFTYLAALSAAGAGLTSCAEAAQEQQQPNVIFILADDLGYGDLGCYGSELISTPNIDRMAASGVRFTQNYAGSTVSAPSRCALMTGKHTGRSDIRGNKELDGEGQLGISSTSVAEMLKEQNYATGAFGKWGLGAPGTEADPNNKGFDEFFGYNCQRQAHRYYPEHLWHNQTKVMLPGNEGFKEKSTFAPTLIQEKALEFIEANQNNPFFAYVAIIQPHAEILAEEHDNALLDHYRAKFETETPFVSSKPGAEYGDPNFDIKQYCSQAEPHAHFAAMVSQVDAYVGEILDKLEELGIAENTLVIFSSDNGPHLEGGADPDFFNSNGPLTGYKRSMTDGGIRLPLVASWKGTIAPGQTSDHITAFWDFMPTVAELTGATAPADINGISYLPTLLGQGEQEQHDYLYWEFQGSVAIRMGDWKAIKMQKNKKNSGEIELYNVVEDIAETNNLAAQHPELVAKAEAIFAEAHTYNPTFPLNPQEVKQSKADAK